MKVQLSNIREQWTRAKRNYHEVCLSNGITFDTPDEFHADFAKATNVEAPILYYNMGFPVIKTVTFTDEQSYMWFMLRWS